MYPVYIMRQTAFALLIIGLLLSAAGCGSSPSNVQNQNQNSAPANSTAVNSANTNSAAAPSADSSTTTVEKSPAGDEKISEANYPQIVREIHRRVNDFRQSQGLAPLELNPVISEQARQHSVEMSQTPDTISHKNFAERIEQLRKQLPYQASAENVAANLNYENPGVEAVEGWKNSPSHRKNILGDYNQTGIGIAQSENGSYFFTQVFWKS